MKYLFKIFEPNEFHFELEIMDNGNLIFYLKNELLKRYYKLDSPDKCSLIELEDIAESPGMFFESFTYMHKLFEIRMAYNSRPLHINIEITDNRFNIQKTLFTQNIPLNKIIVLIDSKRLETEEVLYSLYESFVNAEKD